MSLRFPALLCALCTVIACEVISVEETPEETYPIIIPVLETGTLSELNQQYQVFNNGELCSTLNEFGFTGFSRVLFPGGVNPCLSREPVRVELTNQDTLRTLAKEILVKNALYTNVTDTVTLELLEELPINGCTVCEGPGLNNVPIEWKFTFRGQEIEGFEVPETQITVFVDNEGVNRVWGNWYPEVVFPPVKQVGFAIARQKMEGWQFFMEEFTGEEIVFTVSENELNEIPVESPLVLRDTDRLEIRNTWKVPIHYSHPTFSGWFAFVDVMDGTILKIEPKLIQP
ncbi:MAG: hypothetical protein AAFW89_06895 [Bacteroidota bacterium]